VQAYEASLLTVPRMALA